MPVDDGYTITLLHMNGADASTTFTDESGKTWTAAGNAQIDTAQSKFGGASALFDGTGDKITTGDSADFDIGSGSFTVDFWYRPNAVGAARLLTGQSNSTPTVSTISFYVQHNADNTILGVICTGSTQKQVTTTGTVSSGTWYHIAFVRNGNSMAIALDGTFGSSLDVTGVTANNSTNSAAIGGCGEMTTSLTNGWIDEYRFSKGVARWTANFTPPTSEYGLLDETGFFF